MLVFINLVALDSDLSRAEVERSLRVRQLVLLSKNSFKDFFKHDADMPSKISFVLKIEVRTSLVANFPVNKMGSLSDGARNPPEKNEPNLR